MTPAHGNPGENTASLARNPHARRGRVPLPKAPVRVAPADVRRRTRRVHRIAQRAPWSAVGLLNLLVVGSALAAPSPRELVQQGNEHYAAGRYAEALAAYEQAASAGGSALGAELLHDRAAAHFKLGQLDEARGLWVQALALKDAAFEARTRYNLGNCDYALALQALQARTPQGAGELLDRAIEQYRDAIRLDAGLENARANLELAYQLKTKLDEAATTQPQSQPSTQPGDQKKQDRQKQQSTQPGERQQGDSGDREEQDEPSTTQPATQPSEPPSTQPDSAPPPPESQPATQPDQGNAESQPASQTEPSEPGPERSPEEQVGRTIHLTREQAERLLQQIRDAEKLRRKILLQREAVRHRPVDRDW